MEKLFPAASRGFTLIEAMVVIAIASILMALAAPSFRTMTQKFRAEKQVGALNGDLQFARSEAIKQGMPVTICASTNGTTCTKSNVWETGWIVFSDPAANQTVTTVLRIQRSFGNTDTLRADNATATWITYSRDGFTLGLPGTSGVVTFVHKAATATDYTTRCVEVGKAGRLKALAAKEGNCS